MTIVAHLVITEFFQKSYITLIRHVNKIPTMQLFTGISKNTQSRNIMISLTVCVWDTHYGTSYM